MAPAATPSPGVPFTAPSADLRGAVSAFDGRTVTRIPFARVAADVEAARARLLRSGLTRGSCVGLIGENCYEWIVYDLAVLSLDCVSVSFPLDEFAAVPVEELARRYDLTLLVATRKSGKASQVSWALEMDGDSSSLAAARPVVAPNLRRRIEGTDVCSVIFSSGTSGQLKALLLSRAGVDSTIATLADDWLMGRRDGILVALPLSIFQQRLMVYAALRTDTDVLLTDPPNLFRSFKVLRPTIVLGPPAIFEAIENRCRASTAASWRVRLLLARALAGVPGALRQRLRRRVLGEAGDAFGGRVRVLLTGSAPSRRSTLEFYALAGLPLFQAYGLAEVGFIAWNRPSRNRLMSVGQPILPGTVSIADDGEIIVAVPHPQAVGYFGIDPVEESRTFLSEGRVATGDIGRIDKDGYLFITGRKKAIVLLQSGEKLNPEPLEAALASIGGVERAVVLGGGDLPGLAAVIAIDPSCSAAGEATLRETVDSAIRVLNGTAKPAARITRFIVTRVAFRPETGLVTRNLKLDRAAVQRRFEREFTGPAPDVAAKAS